MPNMRVVNDFCAAWPSHDLQKVISFFADDGAYRVSERQELFQKSSLADGVE